MLSAESSSTDNINILNRMFWAMCCRAVTAPGLHGNVQGTHRCRGAHRSTHIQFLVNSHSWSVVRMKTSFHRPYMYTAARQGF